MVKVIIGWTALLALTGIMSSCSFDGSETINEEYLETSRYRSFKSRAETEIQQNLRRHRQLGGYVSQLVDCKPIHRFPATLTITRGVIDTFITPAAPSQKRCTVSSTLNDVRFDLTALGKTEFDKLTVLWLLLDLQAAYEDYQLLAASFKGGKMVDFRSIGIFKRNLSEQLMSKVRIQTGDEYVEILSETERRIKYPIEQQYRVEQNYRIGSEGIIKQLQ